MYQTVAKKEEENFAYGGATLSVRVRRYGSLTKEVFKGGEGLRRFETPPVQA